MYQIKISLDENEKILIVGVDKGIPFHEAFGMVEYARLHIQNQLMERRKKEKKRKANKKKSKKPTKKKK